MNDLAEGTFQGLHPDEVALFQAVLKGLDGDGVEIGCLDGYSSRIILDASELYLVSIDPFIPDSMEPSLVGSERRYMQNVAMYHKPNWRAQLFRGYSWEAVEQWNWKDKPRPPINFLFIDGDHRYEEVLRDFTDWTPHLKQGGILAIHDARMMREGGAPFHPGPSRVAHEQVFSNPHEWEVIGEAFSLVLARKR